MRARAVQGLGWISGRSWAAEITEFRLAILPLCPLRRRFPPDPRPFRMAGITLSRPSGASRSIDLPRGRSYNSPQPRPSSARTRHFGREPMRDVFICDAVRTPIGRFGGSLAKVRADDLAAAPIKALMAKHPKLDWSQVD